eukprot:3173770-Prorocentrum_lima.AAC.1
MGKKNGMAVTRGGEQLPRKVLPGPVNVGLDFYRKRGHGLGNWLFGELAAQAFVHEQQGHF